jgi:tyrosyl-tRNA synthetase
MTLSEELSWRGFVNQTTYKDIKFLDGDPISFYWGVDPSSDSMQIGNLAAAMMVKAFMKHGHHPFLLIGGATGMVGDPDGKAQERELLTVEQIQANKQAIAAQYSKVFGDRSFELVDNYDWFKDMGYLDFLRGVGKHVPMRQMLARDFIQTRLGDGGSGISYAEFSYVLIQAYDFLYLYRNHGVSLQVCGSDQWGNSIAGVDLIRRTEGAEANVYSVPLIVNKATGQKFGKSEAGAIWLDSNKTSVLDFYQFWINLDDQSALEFLKIYTELDKENIDHITEEHQQNPSKRLAQTTLANEVTKLVHGEAAAEQAKQGTASLLSGGDLNSDSLPKFKVKTPVNLIDLLIQVGLAGSKGEARRLIEGNGIYIDGKVVKKENLEAEDFKNGKLLLRRGKALKDSALIELDN